MFNDVLTHIGGGRFAVLLLGSVSTSMAGASRVSFNEEDELERILKVP